MFIQAKENQQSAFVRTQYDLKKYESRFLILIQNIYKTMEKIFTCQVILLFGFNFHFIISSAKICFWK